MAGSFQASSEGIRIEWNPGYQATLYCMARDNSGYLWNAQITLDDYIGNYDGSSTLYPTKGIC